MSDNIKVAIRLRNLIKRETENNATVHWAAQDSFAIQQVNSTSPVYFDRVFAGNESNEVVYSEFCSPIVKSVINGFNGTIFAYGQTSSGKTFTLMGDDGLELGIIHHTVFDLFEHIQNMPDREFLLRVSYMEIYNERVIDLLSNSNENLKLQDQYGTIKVNKLTELIVQEPSQVLDLIRKGQKQRRTGETVMNNKSSRSHAIFRMIIESGLRGVENAAVNVSQFNIIDLAGSEKAGLNKGAQFTEGVNINKSLFMLSQVISQLSAEKEHQFINYRDSKLTRILQNSLGGNALTAIICTVTPASLEETASTLKFALRAKKIKNKPHVNEIQTEQALLKKYANKIKKLTEELEATKEEKDQEAKICKNLQQQIENLKKNFVSRIAPVKSRAARRETWGGCLDTARLKMMFPPPRDLLLPHEMSTRDTSEQNISFTPRKIQKKRIENVNDLTVVNEETEIDIETAETDDICNLTQASNFQPKYSFVSNPSEFLKSEDVSVQTDQNFLTGSPTKAILESEKLKSLSEIVLDLKQELNELYIFTKLEKQMFVEQSSETNSAIQNAFNKAESFSSISPIFPVKNKHDSSNLYSTSFQDAEDDSLGVINHLINSDGQVNVMNLNEEMFFEQLHSVVTKFTKLLNIEITVPIISNPYLKVIFQLLSLYFQSQSVLCGNSSTLMSEQVQEMLVVLSKIFIDINSQNSIDQTHAELTERFVDITDVVLKELESVTDKKQNCIVNEISYVSPKNSEHADCFDIPDLINVSCSKTTRSSINPNKIAKVFENAESQTSILEDALPLQPSDGNCQQTITSLEESIKDYLKTISVLEHDCSIKKKQISLSKGKIDIQEQIIQSLKNELDLKNETIRSIKDVDIMNNYPDLKDNFSQTCYFNSNCHSFCTEKLKENCEIQESLNVSYNCSGLHPEKQAVSITSLSSSTKNDIETGTENAPDTFDQLKDIISITNQTENVKSCEANEKHTIKLENNSDLSDILNELKDLKLYAFDVMEMNMKKEYLFDINLSSTENYENASCFPIIKSEVQILKDLLHRIGFYLKDRYEAFEHFNHLLEIKIDEMSTLQKKCSNIEDSLNTKTNQLAYLSEKMNILRKNIAKMNSKINLEHFLLSDQNEVLDAAEYLYDLNYIETTMQKLVKHIEEQEFTIKSFQEKQTSKQTQSTQTFESSKDIISVETLRKVESEAKEKYEKMNEENSHLKLKIESLNKEISSLNCEIKTCRQEIEEANTAQETIEKHWEIKMKECIKSLEEKYDQEMKNQENDLFEKMENMLEELKKQHHDQQKEKDEYYNKQIDDLEDHYANELSKCEEKYKAIEVDLKNKLEEKTKDQHEIKLKLEEEIKLYKIREADLKQSYAFIRNKFKEYTQDIRRMRMSKEKSLKEKETQTHFDKNKVKTSEVCNECLLLKKQLTELKNKIKTENLKHPNIDYENLKHELDLKNVNVISLKNSNENMVKEITYLKKELDSKSALLQTCNCRLIAKPQDIAEDFKKFAKIGHTVLGVCSDVDTQLRKEACCTDPKSVLQLDIVQKAIQEARQEERTLLCGGQGPASDVKCLILQRKLMKKEKEIKELKTLTAKKSPMTTSEKFHPQNDKATTKIKHAAEQKCYEKINLNGCQVENSTPHIKYGHPYLNPEAAPKVRSKKVLMEKNDFDPFLMNVELGIHKKTKTEFHSGEHKKEKEIENELNLLSGDPLKSECKQQ